VNIYLSVAEIGALSSENLSLAKASLIVSNKATSSKTHQKRQQSMSIHECIL
jgi:hypothetical protein